MARSLTDGRPPLLSPAVVAFLRRRAAEVAGSALLIAGAAVLAVLISYEPADPSWNHATAGVAANLLGRPGAVTADLLLQTVGLGGAVPGVVLAVWGWLTIRKRPPRRLTLRAAAALSAMLLLAPCLTTLPVPAPWPLSAGLGGAGGATLLVHITTVAEAVEPAASDPALYATIAAAVLGALGILALLAALGLSRSDWRRIGGVLGRNLLLGARVIGRAATGAAHLAWRTAYGYRQPAFDEADVDLDSSAPEPAGRRRRTVARTAVAVTNVVETRSSKPRSGRRAEADRQPAFEFGDEAGYRLPQLQLLDTPPSDHGREAVNREALRENARLLATVLDDFGVRGEIGKVRPGPVVTLYELEPAPGTKTARVIGLADDIARSMSAASVRAAVVPGRNAIGIELPNLHREMVVLRELLASEAFERNAGKLTLVLGKDIGGAPVMVDLARMPHLLIAGTTGSGKSVAINAMILSLLYRMPPDACKFILIDPKMLELSVYDGIPHLLSPVVTEPSKAVVALKWTVREMEERYRTMSQLGVRNIAGYNARLAEAARTGETLVRRVQTGFDADGRPVFEEQPLAGDPMPFIVVVADEMADLMLVAGKDVETAVQRLSQMARAAGIHLIMATQRPSVDVITGTIKANFPTRVSFQVTSKFDSRTILGDSGAEQLLGQGDMLYMVPGGRVIRIHGPFVSDEEVESVVGFLKAQGEPQYLPAVTEEEDEALPLDGFSMGNAGSGDDLYDQAVALVAREGRASTSFVQRHLQIGYNRAARMIEQMEADGVVSKPDRVGRREVLVGDHGG